MRKINQAQFMREFNDRHREKFEPELFERSNEEMIESIHQVLLSCETDKYFTLLRLTIFVFSAFIINICSSPFVFLLHYKYEI